MAKKSKEALQEDARQFYNAVKQIGGIIKRDCTGDHGTISRLSKDREEIFKTLKDEHVAEINEVMAKALELIDLCDEMADTATTSICK